PAGIGPDLCVMLAERHCDARLAVLGDLDVLAARAARLDLTIELMPLRRPADAPPHRAGTLCVVPVEAAAPVSPGTLDSANAGDADALVTAPVQKSVIAHSGVAFSGHTEFFAERTGSTTPVMLLAGDAARVALVTTHLPLRAVPDAITAERIESVGTVLRHGL